MEEKNNISLDDLASIIKGEFDNVQKEFGEVHKEFGHVHKEIAELKQGQENIELKLSNVAYRFELRDLETKLNILTEDVEDLKKKVNAR